VLRLITFHFAIDVSSDKNIIFIKSNSFFHRQYYRSYNNTSDDLLNTRSLHFITTRTNFLLIIYYNFIIFLLDITDNYTFNISLNYLDIILHHFVKSLKAILSVFNNQFLIIIIVDRKILEQ